MRETKLELYIKIENHTTELRLYRGAQTLETWFGPHVSVDNTRIYISAFLEAFKTVYGQEVGAWRFGNNKATNDVLIALEDDNFPVDEGELDKVDGNDDIVAERNERISYDSTDA